jgi:hypothetical protein
MFAGCYNELEENIANTWQITPKMVMQYHGIANFKETMHTVWIQAYKDPENQWIQLRYCVKEEDV